MRLPRRFLSLSCGVLAGVTLAGGPAAAVPVLFELTLTETLPGSAQYAGTFSVDSSVLESGKAINLASIGIDVTVAGFDFTTASDPSSLVVLGMDGISYLEAVFLADQPDGELHLSNAAADGEPVILRWSLVEGRDPTRLGTYSFSAIPEPGTLLLLATGFAMLRLHARRVPGG
jgi:hypothetical protein